MSLMTDCRCGVVRHDRRAVGGAGADGRVMAAATTRWFVSLRNGDFDYVLEQHKGPGRGDARDLWLRSSVGWSGARS